MTRSLDEDWGLLVKWPSKNDAHSWPRSDDRRAMRLRGRVKYGYNCVQEIGSGTPPTSGQFKISYKLGVFHHGVQPDVVAETADCIYMLEAIANPTITDSHIV